MISDAEADRIMAVIAEAEDKGAKILCGNTRTRNVIQPTVITGTTPAMRIAREEIFGPVVMIERVESIRRGDQAGGGQRVRAAGRRLHE